MRGFNDYWLKAKIPASLSNLKQKQWDALRRIAQQAYAAGLKEGKAQGV